MAFTEIVANDLAKSFVQAKNKKYALNRMIFEINYLTDPRSKEPLDFVVKSAILLYIDQLISGEEKFDLAEGEELTPVFDDIDVFFKRKNYIIGELKVSGKQKAMLN
jgi:hypothetical protein